MGARELPFCLCFTLFFSKLVHDNMWVFYHMLRPELVRRWTKPLCADAFSNFQSPAREAESKAHNQEVRAATSWLETEGVLRVARACLNANDLTIDLPKVAELKRIVFLIVFCVRSFTVWA